MNTENEKAVRDPMRAAFEQWVRKDKRFYWRWLDRIKGDPDYCAGDIQRLWKAWQAALQSQAGTAQEAWISVEDRLPEVKRYSYGTFIIAIKRENGLTYVFEAQYLNDYPVCDEDGNTQDDDGCALTLSGWHREENDSSGCHDRIFEQVENGTDFVTHWMPLPPTPDKLRRMAEGEKL